MNLKSKKSFLPANINVASAVQYIPDGLLILCHEIGHIDLLFLKKKKKEEEKKEKRKNEERRQKKMTKKKKKNFET